MIDQGTSRKREVHAHGTGNSKKSQSREDMRAYKLHDSYRGSTSSSKPSLLDLPAEVLDQIIPELRNPEEGPNWHQKLGRRHSSSTKAIKNLRLRCRFLNESVSPLLAPVIVVEDTMESVDRLSKFAEHPLLRKEIRRIHINFVFYSPTLARDI
ncbi:hypothetical protein Landi51_07468 [Colletotrichum acutatum]